MFFRNESEAGTNRSQWADQFSSVDKSFIYPNEGICIADHENTYNKLGIAHKTMALKR